MDADILTAEQVADLLHCDVATVENRTRAGELPGVKFGRGWVYARSELIQTIAVCGRKNMKDRPVAPGPKSLMAVVPPRRQTRAASLESSLGPLPKD